MGPKTSTPRLLGVFPGCGDHILSRNYG